MSRYGDRPELYANGIVPKPGVATRWQPAFSNPETIDIVVRDILEIMARNPARASVSLGVNDGGGYEAGKPIPETYYGWVNQVVARVTAVYSRLRFGLLAYNDLEVPPPFALHPSVIPFLTEDRYAWIDPRTRQSGEDLLHAWSQHATELGTYDYLYGSPYAVPRMYLSLLGEVYAKTRELGVRYHYSELYPNWGEGPKPWVIAQLLRNPYADVAALVDDWCRRAVGSQAAGILAEYYRLWEEVWTTRIAQSPWFISGRTYQPFDAPGYLAAVDIATLDRANSLMNDVVTQAEAGSQDHQQRASKLAEAHEYYDLTARLYPRPVPIPGDAPAALDLTQAVLDELRSRENLLSRRAQWLAAAKSDPILVQPLAPSLGGLAVLSAYNHYPVWALIAFLRAHEPAGGEVTQWLAAHRTDHPSFTRVVDVIMAAVAPGNNIVKNPGFEANLNSWSMWVTDTGAFQISTAQSHSGSQALRAVAVRRGGPIQTLEVGTGILVSRLWVKADPGMGDATIQNAMNLFNSANQPVGTVRGESMALQGYEDGWQPLTSWEEFTAPTNPDNAVATAQFVPILTGVPEGKSIYIDDVEAIFVRHS